MEGEYDDEEGEEEDEDEDDEGHEEDFDGLEDIRGQLDPDDVVFVRALPPFDEFCLVGEGLRPSCSTTQSPGPKLSIMARGGL